MKGDEAFIYATWLRGLYHSDTWYNYIKKDVFMHHYHRVIEHILNNPTTEITLACLKDDESVIVGYSVGTKDKKILHFTFVKKAWRNIGVAKMLISVLPQSVTHVTKVGLSLIQKLRIDFNPFAI